MKPSSSSRRGRAAVATTSVLALVTAGTAFATPALAADGEIDIQILAVNDFHGRIVADHPNGLPGAAYVAGAIDHLRGENPNTLFVSAGDNIGASIFESFSLQDAPTIDALAAMGLDVSAVGNHEFDQGLADLVTRVLPRYSASDPGTYGLGANVYYKGTTIPRLQEYSVQEVDGVKVGFIGTVTTDTPNMVTPTGVAGLDFGDELEAVERVAGQLSDGNDANGEADVIVLLSHSGWANGSCEEMLADTSGFADFLRAVPASVDAIFTGHTHQSYACDVPVGSSSDTRPVVQGLEYGKNLSQVVLTVDETTKELVSAEGASLPLLEKVENNNVPVYGTANATVAAIVTAAQTESGVVGAQEIGKISGDIVRAGTPAGSDRGAESTLGNLIADIQLWATSNDSFAGVPAQVGIMNPGGLRTDLLYTGDGTVTFKQVANVQPFANTLVAMDLTGAQLKELLTLQWKDTGDRPKLHLGISEGFEYYYTETSERSGVIHQIRYNGEVVADDDVLRVVTNSFLAAGGDGFGPFADGVNRADTGQVDLAATVAYFEAHGTVAPAALGRAIAGQPPATPEEPEPPVTKIATTTGLYVVDARLRTTESATAIAFVVGATSGTVEFLADGKVFDTVKLSRNGTAKATYQGKVGTHKITARFVENATHLGSQSAPYTVKVTKGWAKLYKVKSGKKVVRSHQKFTINGITTPRHLTKGGTVIIRSGGKTIGKAKVKSNGRFSIQIKASKLGKKKGVKNIKVRFEKTDQLGVSPTVTLKVRLR